MKRDQTRYRAVAKLHADNIDQGFLTTLGIPFLALLYEAIDSCESGVLFTEERGGQVVGFVAGADGMGRIYRSLLRRWWRVAVSLLPALFSPTKVRKIAEILLHGQKSISGNQMPRAELLSIAIEPACRGQGIAQKLYLQLLNHFKSQGITEFRIVVGDQLAAAHKFYAGMGAERMSVLEVHAGQKSVLYAQRCDRETQNVR